MDDYGWIKLHRKLRNNPLMRRPNYRAVWIELLFEAEHGMKKVGGKWVPKEENEMRQVLWNGQKIYLQPGQLTCGAKQISEWTGVSRGTVERILKRFKSEEQIEVLTSNHFSLITVKKWKQYQMGEEQNEEQMRNQRGTSEEPVRTPRERKNEDNDKNDTIDRQKTPRDNAKSFFTEQSVQSEIVGRLEERGILDAAQEVSRFVSYWSELTLDGKKQRWETERTFEVDRRLTTWFSRKKQNSPIKPSQQWHVIE